MIRSWLVRLKWRVKCWFFVKFRCEICKRATNPELYWSRLAVHNGALLCDGCHSTYDCRPEQARAESAPRMPNCS